MLFVMGWSEGIGRKNQTGGEIAQVITMSC